MAPPRNPSHAEIWDDSALVDSWNEALEEYKHYHSMHARGEKVSDVLKETSREINDSSGPMAYEDGAVTDEQGITSIDEPRAKSLAHEAADHMQTSSGNAEQPSQSQDKQSENSQASVGPSHSNNSPPKVGPQHLIAQVHDESLKNLLMSWYYAGYYTGLYEGQTQKPAA